MKNLFIIAVGSLLFASCMSPTGHPDKPFPDQPYNKEGRDTIKEDGKRLSARLPKVFFLSPAGNDANPGTFEKPIFSLKKLWTLLQSGTKDSAFLLNGTYAYDQSQYLQGKNGSANGTDTARIYIGAFPGHKPKITRSATYNAGTQQDLIYFEGEYFYWYGIEIAGFDQKKGDYPWPAFRAGFMRHSVMEKINYHHNGAGMSIRGNSTNNLFLNCDFSFNQNPFGDDPYGGADGVDIHYVPAGTINTFRNCRAHDNSDDGFDCWANAGTVIFDSCISARNGFIPGTRTKGGDGCGWKLGEATPVTKNILRRLTNCIAYDNNLHGFSESNCGGITVYINNTVWGNGEREIWTNSWVEQVNRFENNISKGRVYIASYEYQANNSWQNNRAVNDSDFITVDPKTLFDPRKSDGSLPDILAFRVQPNSKLRGLGASYNSTGIPPPVDPPADPPVTVSFYIYVYTDNTAFVIEKPKKKLRFKIAVYSDGTYK